MNGQQRSPKPRSGKLYLKLIVSLLCICLALTGCARIAAELIPGPGRDDWQIEICDQYYIVRINSNSRAICKATDISGVTKYVVSNYYVTRYCVFGQYIGMEGIPTEETFISEQERTSNVRQYYLLDTSNDTLYGPYNTEVELLDAEIVQGIGGPLAWEIVP